MITIDIDPILISLGSFSLSWHSLFMVIVTAVGMLHRIDRIIADGGNPDQDEELSRLKRILSAVSMSTMCHQKELELPTLFIKLKVMPALRSLLMKR
jgi:hypothetical protein